MTTTVSRATENRTTVLERLDAWLLDSAPAERLGAFRIAVGIYAFVNVVISVGEFNRLANRPANEFEPIGLAGVLDAPVSPALLWLLYAVSLVTGLAFLLGAKFRVTGPIFALCTLAWATYHASWGQMLHFEHLVTLHVLVLGFAPAADAWSVDARRRSAPTTCAVRYGWPLRLAAIITVITYSLAGIAKLRASGWEWFEGDVLANHIGYSATRKELLGDPSPPLARPVIEQYWSVRPMAIAALALELFAPFALIKGWFRRLWVPAILLFHLGTLLTMFVFFSYNGLGFALLPLFRIERAAAYVPRRFRPTQTP